MRGITPSDFGSTDPDNLFDQILDEAMITSFGSKDPSAAEIGQRGFKLYRATRGEGHDARMALVRDSAREIAVAAGLSKKRGASSSRDEGSRLPQAAPTPAAPAPAAAIPTSAPTSFAPPPSSSPTVAEGMSRTMFAVTPNQPGPEPGQPGEGTGASIAATVVPRGSVRRALPPTAAYLVGDKCETQAEVQMREAEDMSSDRLVKLPRGTKVEVLDIGTRTPNTRLRVCSVSGWDGWISIVSASGVVLLNLGTSSGAAAISGAAVQPGPEPGQPGEGAGAASAATPVAKPAAKRAKAARSHDMDSDEAALLDALNPARRQRSWY